MVLALESFSYAGAAAFRPAAMVAAKASVAAYHELHVPFASFTGGRKALKCHVRIYWSHHHKKLKSTRWHRVVYRSCPWLDIHQRRAVKAINRINPEHTCFKVKARDTNR